MSEPKPLLQTQTRVQGPTLTVESFEPDEHGHFGPYGGQYVPETLMAPLAQVEETWREMRDDPEFNDELKDLLHT